MPVYLTPGVYVEELYGEVEIPRPLWSPTEAPGADDSTRVHLADAGAAAFLGLTERPAVERDVTPLGSKPVLVQSWQQYVDRFGGCVDGAYLPRAVRGFFANGGRRAYILSLGVIAAGAARPTLSASDFEGSYDQRTGLAALEPLTDVTAVCAPDLMVGVEQSANRREVARVQEAMIASTERRGWCMALLDTPSGLTPSAASQWRSDAGLDRAHAALFYPWIQAGDDPAASLTVPPCGHVAGALTRTYEAHGPHASPANQALANAVDLETRLAPSDQDILNPTGVNVLRVFPDGTVRIWGSRTLSSEPAMRRLQDRLLTHAVARSIEQGVTWAIFQRDDRRLRQNVCAALYNFLRELWQRGALVGDTEQEAFYVANAEREDGAVVVPIGFAAQNPGEFRPLRVVLASEQALPARRADTAPHATPTTTRPEIFVSYDRDDWSTYVEELVRTLRQEGFNVWVDQHLLRGGEDWMDAINDALVRCPVMVLCLSPDAVASRHVKLEYRYFFNEGKTIVPVMCRAAVLPAELRGLQYIEYAERARLITHLKQVM